MKERLGVKIFNFFVFLFNFLLFVVGAWGRTLGRAAIKSRSLINQHDVDFAVVLARHAGWRRAQITEQLWQHVVATELHLVPVLFHQLVHQISAREREWKGREGNGKKGGEGKEIRTLKPIKERTRRKKRRKRRRSEVR